MSTFRRFQRLMNHWLDDLTERIRQADAEEASWKRQARKELEEFEHGAAPPPGHTPSPDQTPAARHPQMRVELIAAYKVLGVQAGADFAVIRSAYFKMQRRADPEKWPNDSEENKKAKEIRKRVDEAYETLRREFDTESNRFRDLRVD